MIWWNDLIWTWLDELQDAAWEIFKKLLDNSWQCEKQIIFCFIYLRLSVPGLDTVPLQFSSHVDHLVPGSAQPHKPLGRTRSEPLPQSQRALHTHLLQQQHSAQLLERLKQQTHLGKVSASKCTLLSILTERTKWVRFREPRQPQIWRSDQRTCLEHILKLGSFPWNVLAFFMEGRFSGKSELTSNQISFTMYFPGTGVLWIKAGALLLFWFFFIWERLPS